MQRPFPHTLGQAQVVFLVGLGVRTSGSIERLTCLRRRTVQRILARLMAAGLIERERCKGLRGSVVLWRILHPAAWRGKLLPVAAEVLGMEPIRRRRK